MPRYKITYEEGEKAADTMKEIYRELEDLDAQTKVLIRDTKEYKIIRKGEAGLVRDKLMASLRNKGQDPKDICDIEIPQHFFGEDE